MFYKATCRTLHVENSSITLTVTFIDSVTWLFQMAFTVPT